MIYNTKTRELVTDAGELIKVLDCPLKKEWDSLQHLESSDKKRLCTACGKSVIDMAGMTDVQALSLLRASPETCIYVNPRSSNIKVIGPDETGGNKCPLRVIKTARDQETINNGARAGHWPLVKRVEPSPAIHSKMAIFQNTETGEIAIIDDYRVTPRPGFMTVIDFFPYYPEHFRHPYAAYLIPKDLRVGEMVVLEDLIEDMVEATIRSQGDTFRLKSANAIWNGQDFDVVMSDQQIVTMEIG